MADSESSSEEMIAPTPRPVARLPPGEPDSDDDSEEKVPAKPVASQTGAKVVDESDDSDDDEEMAAKAKASAKTAAALKNAGEDDEDDEDDEDKPKPKAAAPPPATQPNSSKVKGFEKPSGKDARPKKVKGGFRAFVAGLPFKLTEEAKLQAAFADCGEITAVKLPTKENGKARGIGFVTFKSQAGLDAILKLNGNTEIFPGRTIQISKADTHAESQKKKSMPQAATILDSHMVDKMMAAQKAGNFMALASLAEAVAALARTASKSGSSALDKKAKASESQKEGKKKEGQSQAKKEKGTPKVFSGLEVKVSNLPFNGLDLKALRKIFAKCGAIAEMNVPMKDGKSRGMAHITFESKDAVALALALEGTEFAGRAMMVKEKGAATPPDSAQRSAQKVTKAKRKEPSQEENVEKAEKSAEEEPPKKKNKKAKAE